MLDSEDWQQFRRQYESSDDRSCAILCAAYLDDCLDVVVRNALLGNENAIKGLLDEMMPLSSFSAKIKLAFCLNLINESIFHDLDLVRKIRNKFAHKVVNLKFNEDPIENWCFSFDCPECILDPDEMHHLNGDPRQYFILTCAMTMSFLENRALENSRRFKLTIGSEMEPSEIGG